MSRRDAGRPWDRFGKRLRAARERKAMTQTQLQAKCKADKPGNSWVSNLEKGTHLPSSLDDVAQLAKVLQVTPEWLLFGRRSGGRSAPVWALGVGGVDVEVPPGLGKDDLVALWPGEWHVGPGGPPERLLVVCSPSGRNGDGWMVWRDPRGFVVGHGRRLEDKVIVAEGQAGEKRVTVFARVVMVIDPKA